VRTTLTLDDDVAAKLKQHCRDSGHGMKAAVNDLLRLGLNARRACEPETSYRVVARPLRARPGIDLDNVGDLMEQVDGSDHR